MQSKLRAFEAGARCLQLNVKIYDSRHSIEVSLVDSRTQVTGLVTGELNV